MNTGGPQVRDQLGRNLTYGLQDALGRAVVTGDYVHRPFPTEAELAKLHAVSRTVTREAVKMLTAKGLLGARPKQGTFVQPEEQWNLFDPDVLRWLLERKLSLERLRHFNELRIAVEPEAAAMAARRADAAQVAAIGYALEQMREAEQGRGEPLAADILFHVSVLRACGNPFFVQLQDVVETALRTSIRFTNRISGRTANVHDHAAVFDAIAAHDAEVARARMRGLIADVLTLMERAAPAPVA